MITIAQGTYGIDFGLQIRNYKEVRYVSMETNLLYWLTFNIFKDCNTCSPKWQIFDLFHYRFIINWQGPSWSYGSWIYNYLCNQSECLSPLKLWVRTPFMAWCTRYNIMWLNFVSDLRQVNGFLWVLRFPPTITLTIMI
jgi:hypothetical protein